MSAESYIVVFKNDVSDADIQKWVDNAVAQGAEVTNKFTILRGVTIKMSASSVDRIQQLDDSGVVDYVEQDSIFHTVF